MTVAARLVLVAVLALALSSSGALAQARLPLSTTFKKLHCRGIFETKPFGYAST